MLTYERDYSHKRFGFIGEVTFECPDGEYKLNGAVLPPEGVDHLLRFALQTLQDAYAGSDNFDEAKEAYDAKLAKILAGTIGTRTRGDGTDERTRVARSIVKAAAKERLSSKSPKKWVEFTGLEDAEQNAKLDEWYAANAEVFDPAIDDEMARRAAKKAAKAALSKSIDFGM